MLDSNYEEWKPQDVYVPSSESWSVSSQFQPNQMTPPIKKTHST